MATPSVRRRRPAMPSSALRIVALARRFTFAVCLALLLGAASTSARAGAPERPRAVVLTFLKANPGQREQLKQFIVRNWFAMDSVAKARGLISAYTVLDTGTDDGPWNLIVSVTYMNEDGYDGIAAAFEKIRAAHTTVLVDGRSLRDLGAIVDSKQLLEEPDDASKP